MAVLDQHPVAEETGAPGSSAADAPVVAIEAPPADAYLRLVPRVARSVRLRPPTAGRIPDPPGTEMP